MAETNSPQSPDTIIRKRELASQLGISDTTLWRMRDELPPAIQISRGIKGWKRSDIDTWIETRRAAR
jgi:predicted DNA-binding transcriptional regulator AlpA